MWLILLVVLVLIALAARVDAAPTADPIDRALRRADGFTGAQTDEARASALDGDGDDDDAEAAEFDDDEEGGDEEGGDDADPAGRDLVELAGELGGGDPALGGAAEDDPLAATDLDHPGSLGADGADLADMAPADAGSGALAMLDAELDPGDPIAAMDATDAAAPAGAAEVYEESLRHRRPSRWGRLDVGVAWRARGSEPMHSPPNHTSELWLVATWRR